MSEELERKLEDVKQGLLLQRLEDEWKLLGLTPSCSINAEQFRQILQILLHVHPDNEVVLADQLFSLFDANKNGHIEFDEFATLITAISSGSPQEKMETLFKILDLNGDNYITREEFLAITVCLWDNPICRTAINFAVDEKVLLGADVFVESIFYHGDKNKDGKLSFEEYCEIYPRFILPPGEKKRVDHQTGGHVGGFKKLRPDQIMKKVSPIEGEFYSKLDGEFVGWKPLAPQFFGFHEDGGQNYLILEDLTFGMKKPCIMDIKIGTTSIGEDATPDKAEAMRKKDMQSTTHSQGFRITGIRCYRHDKEDYVQFSKSWGKHVTVETLPAALLEYFNDGVSIRKELITQFINLIQPVLKWEESQKIARIYSSSLLFIYDSDKDTTVSPRLRMIDFAHVHPIKDDGLDDGYIFGVRTLLTYLSKLAQ